MKTTITFVAILAAIAVAPIRSNAKTLEQSYIENCDKNSGVPVPIDVVAPSLAGFIGDERVTVEFTVDRSGRPTDCRMIASSRNRRLNAAVVDAVREWSFRPGTINGKAVPRTVIVPFHLVRWDDYPRPFVPAFIRKSPAAT
jgi:TonB family protein